MPTIPEDEAIFYERIASTEAQALSRLDSISHIEDVANATSFRYLAKQVASANRDQFPYPRSLWIGSIYDCLAAWEAYVYLSPLKGKKILQLGGKGVSAIQFMLAGASEAWLLTPVEGEAECALQLARLAGVKIQCRIGAAEDMPFESESFDAIYAGGCVHHFSTETAFPEISRVMRHGARFSAVEPFQAPLYSFGVRMMGKREQVNCSPLTHDRIAPIRENFRESRIIHHGTLLRYAMIALDKFGLHFSLNAAWNVTRADDLISSILGIRRFGSSVSILAERT